MRWWLVLIVALAAQRRAEACTYEPMTIMAPREGAALPPNPRVLAWVPHEVSARFTANAPFVQTFRATSSYGHLYELRFAISEGDLQITLPGHASTLATAWYPIGAPSSHRARVREISSFGDSSCGHRGFSFDVEGDAIGFRIDRHGDDAPIWFTGHYAEHRALGQLRDFDLVALFSDGTERRIGTSTMMLSPDGSMVRRPVELLDLRWPMLAGPWRHHAFKPDEWRPSPQDVDDPRWRIAGALLALLLLLVARPCSWRR